MRLTIVKDDSIVIINGNFNNTVDLSALPTGLHAVQWYETWGEIEWVDENGRAIKNEKIDSLDDYQWVIDAWYVKNQEVINNPTPSWMQQYT